MQGKKKGYEVIKKLFVKDFFSSSLKVIHDGLNCKQYQDRMNSDCDSNIEARRTREMLADMIDKGDAMNCPICQVTIIEYIFYFHKLNNKIIFLLGCSYEKMGL